MMKRAILAIACVVASFVGLFAVAFSGMLASTRCGLSFYIFATLIGAPLFSALAAFCLSKWAFRRPVRVWPFLLSIPVLAVLGFLIFLASFAAEIFNPAYPALVFLAVIILTFQGIVFGFQPIEREPNQALHSTADSRADASASVP